MIKLLVKLKKYLLSNIKIRKLVHYKKELNLDNFSSIKTSPDLDGDITFQHYPKASPNILNSFNYEGKPLIEENTACIVVRVKDEPAGCIFFDLQALVKLLSPFKYELKLGANSAYIHGLFVEKKFRGNGLAKMLYLQAFKVLGEGFRYVDILTEEEAFIVNKMVKELGFSKINNFALIKLFNAKFLYNLSNPLKKILFKLMVNLLKSVYRFIRLPITLTEKLVLKLNKLFVSMYLISDSAEPKQLKLAYFCRNKPAYSILKKFFPQGFQIENEKKSSYLI